MDIIIFGISGNLAERKLIPALVSLYKKGNIPTDTRVVGFSRSAKHFELPFAYEHVVGTYTDNIAFETLASVLKKDRKQLFYLALPPHASRDVLVSIHEARLDPDLILIEKPFGTGLEDAELLVDYINAHFRQGQCLKVDHYAGKKELRYKLCENLSMVSEITCEIFETATVEHRKGFYDGIGALRDVGQNHLLFMLATALKCDKEREDILSHLVPDSSSKKFIFGRYEGHEGKETFFSVPAKLKAYEADHVKITLRAGKGLTENKAAIRIVYKDGLQKETVLSGGTLAYENILLDAIEGRHEYFLSDQEVLAAWRFVKEIEKIKEKSEIVWYPIGYDQRFFNEENA